MKTIKFFTLLMIISLISCSKFEAQNQIDEQPEQNNSPELNSDNKSSDNESKSIMNLELIDGEYVVNCTPISEEEFAQGFLPGWCCSEAFDVYANGSIGKDNIFLEFVGGSSYLNAFAVLTDNLIKVYEYTAIFDEEIRSYSIGNYAYEDNGNILTIDGLSERFKGGTVVSLKGTEMLVVGSVFRDEIPDESKVVMTLYKFNKMSKDQIAEMDLLYSEQHF